MINLPAAIAKELASKPETGMGYQVVSVLLKDGSRVDRVVVVDGRITKVKGASDIPFSESQIAGVVLTHDKWDFSQEG